MRRLLFTVAVALSAGHAAADDFSSALGDIDTLFAGDCSNAYTSILIAREASDPEGYRLDSGRQYEAMAKMSQIFKEAALAGLAGWQGLETRASNVDMSIYSVCPEILIAPDGRVSIYDRFVCADQNYLPLLREEMTLLATECSKITTEVLSGKVWSSKTGLGYPENLYEGAK